MRRFLAGTVLGVLLLPALGALSVAGYFWWTAKPPRVAAGSTLALRLNGEISESASPGRLSTFEIWHLLRTAASDPRITSLQLIPESPSAGWAKLAEIRAGIAAFRQSGKRVTAFLRTPKSKDYYLASAADRIVVPPGDLVNVKGFRVELLYGRGLLDKLGILPEFEAAGKYKDGADTLTRSTMSEPTKEVIDELLDARYQAFIDTVSRARRKTPAEIRSLIDDGPLLAAEAKRRGLIDEVQYEDEALGTAPPVEAIDYVRTGNREGERIALLVASGDIFRGAATWLSDEALDPESFIPVVRRIRDDKQIKATILRIDSPGGDAIASDEMLHELRQLASRKPIVVSMSDIAASGGYDIALAGGPIVAYPETATGSIGVFFGKLSFSGLYDKLGIRKEVVKRGRFADIDSDSRPLTPEGRAKLHDSIQQTYTEFVKKVAAARRKSFEDTDRVAQGRVWLGTAAKLHGLVDELGGFETAIRMVREKTGIPGNEPIRIEIYPQRARWEEGVAFAEKLLRLRRQASAPKALLLKWSPLSQDVE